MADRVADPSMASTRGRLLCSATRTTDGEPCRNYPIPGGTVCRYHGGNAPQVRAAAERRLAEAHAARTLALVMVRPIGDPIVELADVAGQALALLEWALGHAAEGEQPSEEWLLRVERAMDRAGRLLEACGRLGLEERRVRIDEDKLDLMASVMRRAWAELGNDPDDPRVQAALDVAYQEVGQ